MTSTLALVDSGEFDRLFIQHLGWNSPTQPPLTVADPFGNTHTVTQVANFRGMGVWTCPAIPDLTAQRHIDAAVAAKTLERLIIYTDGTQQEWRWPRSSSRKRSGPPTLVPHRHTVGQPNPALVERLGLIEISMGSDITVPELLDKMREAFDREAETASKQAARLMGELYAKLEVAGMGEQESSIFLARMLFLMFGDDTNMWKRNLFHDFIAEHSDTDGSNLRQRLIEAFAAADTNTKDRPKDLNPGLRDLPYINGGIFSDELRMPDLDGNFRKALLETCRFDWGQISPAVFGSMFQTVKTKEARRHLGEHYTTEENILKTIEPLFLDELRERLEAAWDDRKALTKLHNELGEMRFLDPACGCGNFLIVAYRELRALELTLMIRQRDLAVAAGDKKAMQLAVDATHGLKVSLEQFYGIEIEAWPARIAETAMFLIDHQANLRMDHELGAAPTRLPLEVSPHIHRGNALELDWRTILRPTNQTFIFGNPPYSGALRLTKEQQADRARVYEGIPEAAPLPFGRLDYVLCWFAKALDYSRALGSRTAFVSTNSICQGEQARSLGFLLSSMGAKIQFAHHSFPWESEAAGQASLHVIIVGFARDHHNESRPIFQWNGRQRTVQVLLCDSINEYLLPGEWIHLEKRAQPFLPDIPVFTVGSQPTDYGYLMINTEQELEAILRDEVAARYVREYVGADEMIQGTNRWCLWMVGATRADLSSSAELRDRLASIREKRLESPTPQFRRAAETPHLFTHIKQPVVEYLAVPQVSSEGRSYLPMRFFGSQVIASNALMVLPSPQPELVGVLQSIHWTLWAKLVCGRLESRIRIAPDLAYNAFPFPDGCLSSAELKQAADALHTIKEQLLSDQTLAMLYSTDNMPIELRKAHQELDSVVDNLYGIDGTAADDVRSTRLLEHYRELSERNRL